MKTLTALLLVLLVTRAFAASMSPPVNGLRGSLSFFTATQDSTRVVHTVLHLTNVSDVANPIYLTYDPNTSVHINILDQHGKTVEQSHLPADVLTPTPYLIALPYQGTLSFDITAFGYGWPRTTKVFLGLPCGDWILPQTSGYRVNGTFTSGKPEAGETRRQWSGTLQLPVTNL